MHRLSNLRPLQSPRCSIGRHGVRPHLQRRAQRPLQPQASEYGFFSNVNPAVAHPRWSQASERRIAGSASKLFAERIPTLPFSGYSAQVASLYAGMDLKKWF